MRMIEVSLTFDSSRRGKIVIEFTRAENDALNCLTIDNFIVEDRPEFVVGEALDLGNAFAVAQQTFG